MLFFAIYSYTVRVLVQTHIFYHCLPQVHIIIVFAQTQVLVTIIVWEEESVVFFFLMICTNFEGGLQGSVFQNNIVNHIFVMTSKMFFSIWKITHVVVCLLILQILWSHVSKEKFTKQSANQLTRKKKNKSKGESSIICKNINNLNIKSKVSRTALDNIFFKKCE